MKKITKGNIRFHAKASEKYIDAIFVFEAPPPYDCSIPIEYRRTGTEIADEDIDAYLEEVYEKINPANWEQWKNEQNLFWKTKPNADITKGFFDVLAKEFKWCCVSCELPPNPNPQRRIQDLKEFGYTISTNPNKTCEKCKKSTTHMLLLPLPRGGITGYETWSKELRDKIIKTLETYDSFEAKVTKKEGLLPDHKFPEIRWDDETKRKSLENLSETEIKNDFQLLTNQRNQQKREICRNCYQTGKRGTIYGIPYFYRGSIDWGKNIPQRGKEAEKGCVGCAWYDIERWRQELIKRLKILD
ncbi:MAG: restriction endonuclease [Treponema sp.]|jgi:hypothetical protein|nr:restriction endonuclease [Treponema sp.]